LQRSSAGPKEGDPVFYYIAMHRAAVEAGANGDIELFGRALMLASAKSRRGLIALLKYVAMRFEHAVKCGDSYLPDEINGQPWAQAFFRSLARQLRRMGSEFPARVRSKRGKAVRP
jgi:hypothetical protein